jgi:hypothetical protein
MYMYLYAYVICKCVEKVYLTKVSCTLLLHPEYLMTFNLSKLFKPKPSIHHFVTLRIQEFATFILNTIFNELERTRPIFG